MDVYELLRLLHAGVSDRAITQLLRHNRRTIAKYRTWAEEQGLLTGNLPDRADLERRLRASFPRTLPPQQTSGLAAYTDEIVALRRRGVEVAAIRVRLEERHGQPVSYSALRRLVHRLEPPAPVETFVRVEVAPGSEGQVDFGYAGLTLDPTSGRPRSTWVFVLVLSFSRHLYAELVFDQRLDTWLACHEHAFRAFGGVPARIVPDNLKSAIVRASFTDPLAQRSYRECAEHYGFLIDPTPPRSPHLKGKVEQGGVHFVKRNFLAGRDPEPRDALQAKLLHWTAAIAGQRVHGTTKQAPFDQFTAIEQPALLPLPIAPYDPAVWKEVRLQRDGYVVFEGAYYTAPERFVGQTLWARGGRRTVELYTSSYELLYTHDRVAPGERQTVEAHLNPLKLAGLRLTRTRCQEQAADIGPATAAAVAELLAHRPEDRLRSAGKLVRLGERFGAARLERACARAAAFGQGDYPSIKRILQEGLDRERLPGEAPAEPVPLPTRYAFVRQAREFAGLLLGVGR